MTAPAGIVVFALSGMVKDAPLFTIFRGVVPFIAIQLGALLLIALFPELVTWLPGKIYGN